MSTRNGLLGAPLLICPHSSGVHCSTEGFNRRTTIEWRKLQEANGKSSAPIAVKTNLIAGTTWACCWETHSSVVVAEPVQSTVHPSRIVELASSKEPKGLEIYHWPPMKCPSKSLHTVRRPTDPRQKYIPCPFLDRRRRPPPKLLPEW